MFLILFYRASLENGQIKNVSWQGRGGHALGCLPPHSKHSQGATDYSNRLEIVLDDI